MEKNLIDIFDRETQCEYDGRVYRVRDNGSVMRLPKDGRRTRKDYVWSFGEKDPKTGYMLFTGVRIHRIVCTAFHGPEPEPNMVVDHIDTNRCNNRPENLRWLTRLENALSNEATRKKIIYLCGSVEAFIENPSMLRSKVLTPDIGWMKTVTKDEAAACRKHLEEWTAKDSAPSGNGKGIGEWIFNDSVFSKEERDEAKEANRGMEAYSYPSWHEQVAAAEEITRRMHFEALVLKDSLTPGAKQLEWKVPTEFPQTPDMITATPLQDYLARLSPGVIFSRNQFGTSPVLEAAMSEDKSHLSVITKISAATNYGLAEVFLDAGSFVHKSIRTFFTEKGAKKYFTLSLGREWTGGDVFEDYC